MLSTRKTMSKLKFLQGARGWVQDKIALSFSIFCISKNNFVKYYRGEKAPFKFNPDLYEKLPMWYVPRPTWFQPRKRWVRKSAKTWATTSLLYLQTLAQIFPARLCFSRSERCYWSDFSDLKDKCKWKIKDQTTDLLVSNFLAPD